jgi:hypothetical protein
MKHLALIIVLSLLAGTAHGTFEIADPAAQIMEETQEFHDRQAMQTPEKETFCVIDTDRDECFCIHRETRQEIAVTYEECVSRASEPSEIQWP